MTCIDKIVDVIEQIHYDTLPPSVVQKTKDLMCDYIGVVSCGSGKKEARQLLLALGGEKIVYDRENLACWLGTTSRLLDFDDGHRFAMGHPGVVLFSAAIAAGINTHGISGQKLIEAVVRGYEMYCIQGRSINSSAYLIRGFDATAVCGAAGAAVVASTIMDLSREQMSNAIALSATLCGGLNQAAIDGSVQKYFLAGWAAMLGLKSAQLAKHGLDGPCQAFEGRLGYCNAFSPTPNLEYLNNPTLTYDIERVYTKMFSCVRRIHTTLDIVLEAMEKKNLTAESIKKVDVYGCQFLMQAAVYDPENLAKAQTSIPYATALLMQYGEVTEERIRENISNPVISALSRKVEVHLDEEFVKLTEEDNSLWGSARVVVTANDGSEYEKTEIYPLGEYENPFPEEKVYEKFSKLTSSVCSKERTKQLWDYIQSLELQNVFNRESFPILNIL